MARPGTELKCLLVSRAVFYRDARHASLEPDELSAFTGGMVYAPALRRSLLTTFHTGPGQPGLFDAPAPWGPWTTIAYEEAWGGMGATGEGLTCEFPAKWFSADGFSVWAIFSVYGGSARKGVHAHDQFNLLKARLLPR